MHLLRTLPATGAVALAITFTPIALAGDDPFADDVVDFAAGAESNPSYADPATTIGSPERFTGEGLFPSVVSVFSPAYGTDELVSIGKGGFLVVRFDTPVTDDPGNPFGLDLLIFGNAGFIDANWPSGIVGGLFSDGGGTVEVSADGATWHAVPGIGADQMFPTMGFLDSGPYDADAGRAPTDFTLPVDPGLTIDAFDGLQHDAVRALYDGSGGGTGVDLADAGLDAISFVRVSNPADATVNIEIDAFSDVAPVGARLPGDVNGNGLVDFSDLLELLFAWGDCPAPPTVCPADFDGDGVAGFLDLLVLVANWTI